MKYLKLFELFEDTHEICKNYGITNYTINENGYIDVDGNVNLNDRKYRRREISFLSQKFTKGDKSHVCLCF